LDRRRAEYQWKEPKWDDGYPPHILKVPKHEEYGTTELFGLVPIWNFAVLGKMPFKTLFGKRYNEFESFPKTGTIGDPHHRRHISWSWDSDITFGNARLRGSLPCEVHRAASFDKLPAALKATKVELEAIMKRSDRTVTFDAEAAAGHIYFTNYEFFTNVPDITFPAKQFTSAPIIVFWYRPNSGLGGTNKHLLPICIQLLQGSAATAAAQSVNVYFPPPPGMDTERHNLYWAWRFAKTIANNIDVQWHELGPHLTHTHFIFENVFIATHRELPPSHPVASMVLDHSEKTIALNNGGRAVLVPRLLKWMNLPLDTTAPIL